MKTKYIALNEKAKFTKETVFELVLDGGLWKPSSVNPSNCAMIIWLGYAKALKNDLFVVYFQESYDPLIYQGVAGTEYVEPIGCTINEIRAHRGLSPADDRDMYVPTKALQDVDQSKTIINLRQALKGLVYGLVKHVSFDSTHDGEEYSRRLEYAKKVLDETKVLE